MRLGAIYTIWNGLELLKGSIKQIEPHVDVIIIAWQEYSNKGEKSFAIEGFVEALEREYDKVVLLEYTPDFKVNTKNNEAQKHNEALQLARDLGCSHFFLSACDHYYKPSEFLKAKAICESEGYDVTFTQLYTYYKHPTWQIEPIEDTYMPFISAINHDTQFRQVSGYPVLVDPACRITPLMNYYIFKREQIMMHHYSMVRIDVDNKFRNAAASIRWSSQMIDKYRREYDTAQLGDKVSYFKGRKLIEVPNFFYI